MQTEILMNLIKERPITIPKYLLSNYLTLNMTEEELIIIIYMMNMNDSILYDPNIFVDNLGMDKYRAMSILSSLEEKKLISINVTKNKSSKTEEHICLDLLYNKLLSIILDTKGQKDKKTDIYQAFENEFARTLSPMEYEIIKGWINADFSEEIIKEALKEATYNGVSNLRYIDKILFEWKKKNIKTKEDVILEKSKYKKSNKEKVDVFDYNWLDE